MFGKRKNTINKRFENYQIQFCSIKIDWEITKKNTEIQC